ncbi:sensor histidine kinase [Hymenobacter mucosus]|uniref:Histidine kinase n=1 Tax=Hymenobacter mucosus TaxID=1411120 RepID=A0A239AFI6_9BACT|nr:histidine kinase [Hymenobacter mucosus]SNR94330.1 Histidine kinase [Hymenobacter mucosus]
MKKSTLRWHVLAWVAFYVYSCIDEFWDYSGAIKPHRVPLQQSLWLLTSFWVVRAVVFYFCYLVVYPRFLRVNRLPHLAVGVGVAVLLFAGLRASIEEVLFPALLGFHNYTPGTTIQHYVADNFFWSIPTLWFSAALWASERNLHQERENQQLREEKRAAETAFLQAQINPHFLFNTLNLLYGMAYPVSKPLASALLKLAELMRYMLHETAIDQVALTQEIEYVQHYLALYRLRFPDQLFVNFTITGEPAGRQIAPLVLIPFVENALKHGVLDDPAHPVRLQLHVAAQEVVFQVENRISDQQKDTSSGIGLPNLRRRLALSYPGRHQLHIATERGQFTTLLRVAC